MSGLAAGQGQAFPGAPRPKTLDVAWQVSWLAGPCLAVGPSRKSMLVRAWDDPSDTK